MKHLISLKTENEKILKFTNVISYSAYKLLADNDFSVEHGDIGGLLEENLHKMIDAGFTDNEIYYNCNFYKFEEEETDTFHIDLGFVSPSILRIWESE